MSSGSGLPGSRVRGLAGKTDRGKNAIHGLTVRFVHYGYDETECIALHHAEIIPLPQLTCRGFVTHIHEIEFSIAQLAGLGFGFDRNRNSRVFEHFAHCEQILPSGRDFCGRRQLFAHTDERRIRGGASHGIPGKRKKLHGFICLALDGLLCLFVGLYYLFSLFYELFFDRVTVYRPLGGNAEPQSKKIICVGGAIDFAHAGPGWLISGRLTKDNWQAQKCSQKAACQRSARSLHSEASKLKPRVRWMGTFCRKRNIKGKAPW